ncbi:MAG TPA: hypothetical protein VD790_13345 [Thermoleophilaceae bacterium]|nr:hypothetical protein [Thermoleophilaceae bacterium]
MTRTGLAPVGLVLLLLALPAGAHAARQSTVTVPGGANLWLAGGNPAPGDGPGSAPPSVRIPPAATSFKIVRVTGLVSCCSDEPNIPPDGGGVPTSIEPTAGAIGPYQGPSNLPLLGLFLDGMPTGDAPGDIDKDDTGEFRRISPRPKQPFFIGNGRRGPDGGQTFRVPDNATRLYLGIPDSYAFVGSPQKYEDNDGSFRAVIRWQQAREIKGRVMLECGGAGTCSELPIDDVAITATGGDAERAGAARVYRTRTGKDGRYEIKVGEGVYEVRAQAGRLNVRPGERRVKLRDERVGTADFQACGIRDTGNASAAVTGGTWKSDKRSCTNYVEARWRPSATSLAVSWISAPRCSGGERGDFIGSPKVLLREAAVRPGQPGHNLDAQEQSVGFLRPIGGESGDNISGRLNGDNSGSSSGTVHDGACTYGMSGLALKKGG